MTIIHTIQSLRPSAGGPSYSVPALAGALQEEGVAVQVWTADPAEGPSSDVPVRRIGRDQLGAALAEVRWKTPGVIVHDHGVWLPWNHAVAKATRREGISRVVSPRGMLEPWAMRHRRWKKQLAWWLYQGRDLRTAALLHATAAQEAEGFRALGLTGPVLVAANGVEAPLGEPAVHRAEPGPRTLLFLSRIHPKKGLLDLVAAWDRIRAPGWRIVVAGPDEAGHLTAVREAVSRAGMEDVFAFPGPLAGAAKAEAYHKADCFVLPSYSENFGLVVAEGLAAGLPVITTQGTPWQELESHRCGWWIPPEPAALEIALREAIALAPEARQEMGWRGRALVASRYAWPAIARRMMTGYAALVKQ